MGYMGNKGSVSISMTLYQSRMCFVCSHLTPGHKDGAEQRRNADVYEIIRRTRFASVLDTDQPRKIPCHDQVFWFGDLNYRLNMLDSEVRKLVAQKRWDELKNSDQNIMVGKRNKTRVLPVTSIFNVGVEVFDHRKLERALHVNNADASSVHPEPSF